MRFEGRDGLLLQGPGGACVRVRKGVQSSRSSGVAGLGLRVCRGREGVFLRINSTESVLGAERGLCVSS